jgi:four helix bundle protein
MSEQSPGQPSPTPPPDAGGRDGGTDGRGIDQLRSKSFSFALAIVELCSVLESCGEFVVSRQLLDSGAGIGAAVEESVAGGDRGEALVSLRAALKSARQTLFWLRLLHRSSLVSGLDVMNHIRQADEIARMLTATIQGLTPSK